MIVPVNIVTVQVNADNSLFVTTGVDYNNDGVDDWGFCLTPKTNYFQAFLAPVLQTHMRECKQVDGGFDCSGADTGQNIFFDVNNFDALIFNVSYSE